MGDQIKCLAGINLNTNQFLFIFSLRKSYIPYFQEELEKMLKSIHAMKTTNKDTAKIHSENGTWYCSLDLTKSICFLCLVNILYPSLSAIRLLNDIKEETYKIKLFDHADLNILLKDKANYLIENYEKNKDFNDKFAVLEQSFESINSAMKNNIENIVNNQESFKNLEKKTAGLSDLAGKLKGTSTDLKKDMLRKKYLIWFVIGLIFTIVITVGIVIAVETD